LRLGQKHWRWKGEQVGLAFLDFEILHFLITFLTKKGCFSFEREKFNFTTFRPPPLEKNVWLPLEKSTIGPSLEKSFRNP